MLKDKKEEGGTKLMKRKSTKREGNKIMHD